MIYIEENGSLQLRVALLGDPCDYPEYTEEKLKALIDIGFNAIQINIAWLRRPHDEALNLRDVVTVHEEREEPRVAERRIELLRRNAMAKKLGMRTIFHFGSPFMWRNPYTGEIDRNFTDRNNHNHFTTDDPWYDTLNPLVVKHEAELLREFRISFPDVDDILVYTYDQDTWKTSEFGNSKFSRGIPLHERLPDYLKVLHEIWTNGREEKSIMWWEPWELSAGQIYKCISCLPRKGFGMMLHNNIAEVQMARPVDVWFRNVARMCMDLGIPVVGEGFFSSATEEIEPLSIPCPRLVDEQLLGMTGVKGVTGVKEYFGITPLKPDLNLAIFELRLKNKNASTDELLDIISGRFGPLRTEARKLLDLLSDAIQYFPWDASWFARLAGTADIDHGWSGATVRGQICETPSWESTRRSHFMMTDDRQPHQFLLEDVQLRCEMTVECLEQAIDVCSTLESKLLEQDYIRLILQIKNDTDKLRRVAKSYALHLRETNVAGMIRNDIEAGRPAQSHLLEEMGKLLAADVENQYFKGTVLEIRELFRQNPEEFISNYLIPLDKSVYEKGFHTMTTR